MEEFAIARIPEKIVGWAFKRNYPTVKEVDCYQLQQEVKNELINFSLVYFGDVSAKAYTTMFEPFAKMELDADQLMFFNVKDRSCAVGMGASADDTILMYRNTKDFSDDKRVVTYKGAEKMSDLSTWAKTHLVPPIVEFAEEYDELIMGQDSPVIILFREDKDADAPYMKEFEKAAIKNEGKIVFSYASGKKTQYQANAKEFLEVEDHELPMLTALRPSERIRYHSPVNPEFLSEDFITRWVNSVVSR